MRTLLALALILTTPLMACGDDDDRTDGTEGGGGDGSCFPDQYVACTCNDGRKGTQQCIFGIGYAPCNCNAGGKGGQAGS